MLNRERHESERFKKLMGKRHDSERMRVKRCWHQLGEGRSLSSSSSSSSVASEFMSVVADDVLQEIFLRLPNSRSVIACGSVYKCWFSLVSSHSQGGLYFLRKFNHHHHLKRHQQQQDQEGKQLPYTLLLRGNYRNYGPGSPESYWPTLACHNILSDKSKTLHYGKVSCEFKVNYLGFFPWPSGCIVSSFEDLLLIRATKWNFCICNPRTRHWLLLPKNPVNLSSDSIFSYRCGFVCKSNCSCHSQFGFGGGEFYCNCSIKYRVVLIYTREHSLYGSVFTLSVFSSETGKWTKSKFQFQNNLFLWCETSVGNNGIKYWALGMYVLRGVVAFDSFKDYSEAEAEGNER